MDGTASAPCTRAWERNERSHSVGHLFLLLDGLLYLFIFTYRFYFWLSLTHAAYFEETLLFVRLRFR